MHRETMITLEYDKVKDRLSVLDTSTSGATVFIEPAEVRKAQDELNLLRLQEEKEVYRILVTLTGMVESYQRELSVNVETMAQVDFVFAKAKFSKASGPNTGGKTVALKTVGLLTLMVQSGLHVPVDDGSKFAIFQDILADIRDGQSIEQSLSTFSSHIRNIASIIHRTGTHTLVLLGELGAGTDPQEGTGLAIAILEKIYEAGATLLATTHYSEIKTFAAGQQGFAVGCMDFDLETLQPLYRLRIGQAGESNALLIALRLGMDSKLIERAHEITYREYKEYGTVQPAATPRDEVVSDGEKVEHSRQIELGQKIEKARQQTEQRAKLDFKIGDCVFVSSLGRTGIVYEEANGKGEVGVMVMKRKLKVNQRRLSLYIESAKLYPENYDLDIVLESKENRKKRKIMSKRHVEGLTIHLTDDQ